MENSRDNSYAIENFLNYRGEFGEHHVFFTALYSFESLFPEKAFRKDKTFQMICFPIGVYLQQDWLPIFIPTMRHYLFPKCLGPTTRLPADICLRPQCDVTDIQDLVQITNMEYFHLWQLGGILPMKLFFNRLKTL